VKDRNSESVCQANADHTNALYLGVNAIKAIMLRHALLGKC